MTKLTRFLSGIALVAGLAGCQTQPHPAFYEVPEVALATSYYSQVLDVDRKVVTEFSPSDDIAISVYIPRGCGFGEQDGIVTVRRAATGRTVFTETRPMKEDDYIAFREPNPGPGKYNVTFSNNGGLITTTWFEVR